MELPTHCEACGAVLMGAATRHFAKCPIRELIARHFPNYKQPDPESTDEVQSDQPAN
jgi:hypothetical protein